MKEQMNKQWVFHVPCRELRADPQPAPPQWEVFPLVSSPGAWPQGPWDVVVLGQHVPTRAAGRHRPWTLHGQLHLRPLLWHLGGHGMMEEMLPCAEGQLWVRCRRV